MAFTQYGPPELGDWVPQPDFQAEQSKEGGWTATQSFQILRGSLDLETFQDDFRINRPIEDLYPEIEGFWRFLGLASIPRVKHIAGGYSMITVKFAGYTGPSGSGTEEDVPDVPAPVPTYSLRASMFDRNILLHPKVVAIADALDHNYDILTGLKDGRFTYYAGSGDLFGPVVCAKFIDEQSHVTWRELPGGAGGQPSSGDANDFAERIFGGVHTYLCPTFIWSKTWESIHGLADEDIADLGLVDTPDGEAPFSGARPNPENRDWMLVSANQEQEGPKFRNSLEWQLSDRGGWDALLYEE